MLERIFTRERQVMLIKTCKYCNEKPLVVDVGGNNPHYEIVCSNANCKNGLTVSNGDLKKAVNDWNIEN